jgi:hypothetical protein
MWKVKVKSLRGVYRVLADASTPLHFIGGKQRRSIFLYWRSFTFSVFFTREGDMKYAGCGNTEHRVLQARVLP